MKRILIFAALMAVFIAPAKAQWMPILSGKRPASGPSLTYLPAGSTGSTSIQMGSSGTTSALNTSGANLIILVLDNYNAPTPITTDSLGNSYTQVVQINNTSSFYSTIYYSIPTTKGSTTWNLAGGFYYNLAVYSFSGAAASPLGGSNSNYVASVVSTTFQPGSVSPTAGSVVVTGGGAVFNSPAATIGSSFIYSGQAWGGGTVGSTEGYLLPASGSINPTFTGSGYTGSPIAGTIAWFHP